jgi:hypothetical protein
MRLKAEALYEAGIIAVRRESHGISGYGTTRKCLGAQMSSAY